MPSEPPPQEPSPPKLLLHKTFKARILPPPLAAAVRQVPTDPGGFYPFFLFFHLPLGFVSPVVFASPYNEYNSEIKTVDAQESYNNRVLVLVTGYLTGKDNIKKNFTQSFLAPQDKGYFVLNDASPCPNHAIEAREAERDDDEDLRIHDD
ncbi:hypothetical protein Taro_016623 [Colocasia esculenta]|uniref:NTF2 domain-containing protein n=1 Tax=Colocasia esculenta TaxID=4460 RepID=A0A843UP80_COLES|nr:hypothetical protein [Colocasia esculenta]